MSVDVSRTVAVVAGMTTVVPDAVTVEAGMTVVLTETTVTVVGGCVTVERTRDGLTKVVVTKAIDVHRQRPLERPPPPPPPPPQPLRPSHKSLTGRTSHRGRDGERSRQDLGTTVSERGTKGNLPWESETYRGRTGRTVADGRRATDDGRDHGRQQGAGDDGWDHRRRLSDGDRDQLREGRRDGGGHIVGDGGPKRGDGQPFPVHHRGERRRENGRGSPTMRRWSPAYPRW